ncbi:Sec-independent protein translocase subunit TatA/TatB [Rhodohalobacter sp. 614A]|uniref:Sec-independent protein translocase subunit TatA/TatB n=1 Tax=Rhodohalobacter sp. 614A TaxID=2908649 RepID=UPI001F449BCD|nr:twin-arginine translocase TatA/TatE family subunit [Rhodohalobacter sp. 614A]
MGIFGGFEWVIVIFVVFLLFGAKRIPKMAKGIGQAIKEFRNARSNEEDEFKIDKQE